MKDKEWCRKIEDEINSLKEHVRKLESDAGWNGPNQKIIELDIEWPEADIGGLHFNAQKTHGVFDLKENGKYYSRDILFHSARDLDEGTDRDLLSEYLDSIDVKQAFYRAFCDKYTADPLFEMGLKRVTDINVSLPEENQGIKKYNGVSWWYWLRPRSSGSAAYFCYVHTNGLSGHNSASAVGGCAPAFCVANGRGADVS
jgi:hypothetical protein